MQGDEQRCLLAGMNAFLSKPFTIAQLRALLIRWLPELNEVRAAVEAAQPVEHSAGAQPQLAQAINMEALRTIRALDPTGGMDLVKSIFRMFLQSADESLRRVEGAILERDGAQLSRAAHALKSSTNNAGAENLSGLYRQLERLGREDRIDEARSLLALIRREHERAVSRIARNLTGGCMNLKPKKILVADDDPTALALMRAALEKAGFGVRTAVDGADALRQFGEDRFDMVMLDVDMPGGTGHEVCTALRLKAGPLLPIVMVTGMDDVPSVDAAYSAGATDFISKPINWALIGHRVRYLLRGYQTVLDLKDAEIRIRRLAYFDALTGLPNREHFRARLARVLEAARRNPVRLALLCIDLDNFKRINDTLGHSVGDELLRMMAFRLRDALRCDDEVGRASAASAEDEHLSRLGGDEFMVLLPQISSPEHAGIVADRIVRTIAQPMRLAQHEVLVTPSVGIAVFPSDGEDLETLVRNADLAMYFAKRQGPGTFAFFDPAMNVNALKRLTLEGKLRGAIAGNELSLHFQPQFDLSTGLVSSMEALLRWTNAELGPVPPSEFIPVAEETGLILPIGEWVLRAACAQAKAWHDEGLPAARIAVNVSGLQLSDRGFSTLVSAVLRDSGSAGRALGAGDHRERDHAERGRDGAGAQRTESDRRRHRD